MPLPSQRIGLSDIIGTVANVATAFGIVGVGWQLVAEFERTFSEHYERGVPLPMLLGQDEHAAGNPKELRAFFSYFELWEEEL